LWYRSRMCWRNVIDSLDCSCSPRARQHMGSKTGAPTYNQPAFYEYQRRNCRIYVPISDSGCYVCPTPKRRRRKLSPAYLPVWWVGATPPLLADHLSLASLKLATRAQVLQRVMGMGQPYMIACARGVLSASSLHI
jgi:hypothetical protein